MHYEYFRRDIRLTFITMVLFIVMAVVSLGVYVFLAKGIYGMFTIFGVYGAWSNMNDMILLQDRMLEMSFHEL